MERRQGRRLNDDALSRHSQLLPQQAPQHGPLSQPHAHLGQSQQQESTARLELMVMETSQQVSGDSILRDGGPEWAHTDRIRLSASVSYTL